MATTKTRKTTKLTEITGYSLCPMAGVGITIRNPEGTSWGKKQTVTLWFTADEVAQAFAANGLEALARLAGLQLKHNRYLAPDAAQFLAVALDEAGERGLVA
jgi:hypothetical protein